MFLKINFSSSITISNITIFSIFISVICINVLLTCISVWHPYIVTTYIIFNSIIHVLWELYIRNCSKELATYLYDVLFEM